MLRRYAARGFTRVIVPGHMGKKAALSASMTETQFDNGYWYDKDLRAFAVKIGIPGATRIDPDFRQRSGTRYLLNRWREDQIADGRNITYGDLVRQLLVFNEAKTGPLRIEHGRYMNFISDFMADNKGATHEAAVRAWHEVKEMDVPKTYAAWAKHGRLRSARRR